MSRVCSLCNKGRATGHNVSHSNRKTKRVFGANLQKVNLDGDREYYCTRCLRTLRKKG